MSSPPDDIPWKNARTHKKMRFKAKGMAAVEIANKAMIKQRMR